MVADAIRFEWNGKKSQNNLRKHGLTFEDAELVFHDPLRKLEIEGDEHGEIRWRTIGKIGGRIVSVTHTAQEEGEVEIIRIISARRCTCSERKRYEETS